MVIFAPYKQIKNNKMSNFTTLKQMQSELPEAIQEHFGTAWKAIVEESAKRGISFQEGNKLAFYFLVKDGGFETILDRAIEKIN